MCNAEWHSADCGCGFGPRRKNEQDRTSLGHGRGRHLIRWSDFCAPTTCDCGARVYFVRHNGGSVWFDSLGKPWLKHQCYVTILTLTSTRHERDVQQGIQRWLAKLSDPLIGIVTEIEEPYVGDKFIVIKTSEHAAHRIHVLVKFSLNAFL